MKYLILALFTVSCGTELTYFEYLDAQAEYTTLGEKNKKVTARITECTGQDYSDVKIAFNVDTIHGKIVTVRERIFVPNDLIEIHKVLHEIKHVEQQRNDPHFFTDYSLKQTVGFVQDLVNQGELDGHRDSYHESDAYDFADFYIDCVN